MVDVGVDWLITNTLAGFGDDVDCIAVDDHGSRLAAGMAVDVDLTCLPRRGG